MKNKINETVKEVLEDFQKRVEERKKFDMEWQLNMNFYMGNQFCSIGLADLWKIWIGNIFGRREKFSTILHQRLIFALQNFQKLNQR